MQSENIKTVRGLGRSSSDEPAALFDYAFEAAPIGVALVAPSGKIVKANASLVKMLQRTSHELTTLPFGEITHPDDRAADRMFFDEILAGTRDGFKREKRYVRPDGSIVEAELTVIAMRKASGEVVRLLSMIEDVTEAKRTERQLIERATQLELAMEAVRGGFWHLDVATQKFETSDRLARFIGGEDAARLDLKGYLRRMHPDDHYIARLTPLLEGQIDKAVAEYRLKTVNGERWMRCDRRLLKDPSGKPFRIIGVVIDYTEEHIRWAELESDADTDTLTGLYNRRGLQKKFDRIRKDNGYLVLTIDLDGFKEINDTLGHAAGDGVLVETASRLKAAVRPSDAVGRLGGDEFAVLLEGGEGVAQRIADRIVGELAVPIDLVEGTVVAQGSVGGTWSISITPTLDLLMKAADKCLYEAKRGGKKRAVVCEYTEDIGSAS